MCDTHPVTVHKMLGGSEPPRHPGAKLSDSQSTTSYITSRRPQRAGVKEPGPSGVNALVRGKFVIRSARSQIEPNGQRLTRLITSPATSTRLMPTLRARRPAFNLVRQRMNHA
jgi:hypothetical protein